MSTRRHLVQAGKQALDFGLLAGAFCVAFLLRFEGMLPPGFARTLACDLPAVVFVQLLCLVCSGLYRTPWRYISLPEAMRILVSLVTASGLLSLWRLTAEALANHLSLPPHDPVPLGVILIDLPLGFLALLGARVLGRFWTEHSERRLLPNTLLRQVPTLLIGAGRAGVLAAREIRARPDTGILPLGFLDDNPDLWGMKIYGLPVLGPTCQIEAYTRAHGAEQALITIANRSPEAVNRLVRLCKGAGLRTKIIPSLQEIVGGKLNLSGIREVAIEDILPRPPIRLDCSRIRDVVQRQTVLITGAGGSIGSELCRKVLGCGPGRLVLVEQAENCLYQIHRKLQEEFPEAQVVPCVADICDLHRMQQLFTSYRPAVVFHAAAHKHVPMMEWNPGEAVKNNVVGTVQLANLADLFGVERFVMISTDKAVNPTSVMGVSKRVAELYLQAFAQRSKTRFLTVRFGNVLGSAGSVVPLFKEQIARGGPVTVTHPDMKRYFMTIPEACQLVLQAGSMGQGGEIFILDMGDPVKIIDLARALIRLSGLVPDEDIEIQFTGIRPGEKLFEELFLGDEVVEKTRHPWIFTGKDRPVDFRDIDRAAKELGELGSCSDAHRIKAKFAEIVPEYRWETMRQDLPGGLRLHPPHGKQERLPAESSDLPEVAKVMRGFGPHLLPGKG